MPRARINAGLEGVATEIEQRARGEGILGGHVWLSKAGRVIDDFRRQRSAIIEGALELLRDGRGTTGLRTTCVELDQYGGDVVDVRYFPGMAASVVFTSSEAEYDGTVIATLHGLLAERIAEKRRLLRADSRPKMLALFPACPMATAAQYPKAYTGIDADDFAAIVVARSSDSVIALAWRVPPP